MQFDMTKATKTEFEPLAEGLYTVTIEKAEEGKADSGTDYIEMQMRLENKRIVWDRMWADNPTKALFVARACGIEFDGELTPAMLLGKTVVINVVIDEKGDKPRNKVTSYTAANDAANVPF